MAKIFLALLLLVVITSCSSVDSSLAGAQSVVVKYRGAEMTFTDANEITLFASFLPPLADVPYHSFDDSDGFDCDGLIGMPDGSLCFRLAGTNIVSLIFLLEHNDESRTGIGGSWECADSQGLKQGWLRPGFRDFLNQQDRDKATKKAQQPAAQVQSEGAPSD